MIMMLVALFSLQGVPLKLDWRFAGGGEGWEHMATGSNRALKDLVHQGRPYANFP